MDRLQEKTTAPYPPVGADGGQSLSQKPNQSIAEGVTEHKPPERDLEEILRQISRVNDPAYLPTVSMNDLYEQVYPGRPPVVDGLLYAGTYCRVPNYFIKVFANCFMKKSADCTTYMQKVPRKRNFFD